MKSTRRIDTTPPKEYEGPTFVTEIGGGRIIKLREMLTKDILFMEKQKASLGDTERAMKLIERLSIPGSGITVPEMGELPLKEFKKLSTLLTEASGVDDDDEIEGSDLE